MPIGAKAVTIPRAYSSAPPDVSSVPSLVSTWQTQLVSVRMLRGADDARDGEQPAFAGVLDAFHFQTGHGHGFDNGSRCSSVARCSLAGEREFHSDLSEARKQRRSELPRSVTPTSSGLSTLDECFLGALVYQKGNTRINASPMPAPIARLPRQKQRGKQYQSSSVIKLALHRQHECVELRCDLRAALPAGNGEHTPSTGVRFRSKATPIQTISTKRMKSVMADHRRIGFEPLLNKIQEMRAKFRSSTRLSTESA
ncbi:MAG: hypothetical protein R3C30_07095 [Hyphomonadaceae bacterium]